MTHDEFQRNIVAGYAPEIVRQSLPDDGAPGLKFIHYKANGKDFVVVMTAESVSAFVPLSTPPHAPDQRILTDCAALMELLGPVNAPQRPAKYQP